MQAKMCSGAAGLLTFVNCYNVKWTNKLQVIFTAAKVVALGIIIATGLYILFSGQGKSDNFTSAFKNTTTNPSLIAIALYQGLFSYSGWNYLNFVTEELKNPYKNLPRAIIISLLSVITIYVLTNVAYFAVLDPMEMINSDAVAVTFGEKTLAAFSWIMPLSVAMSTFGGLNGGIYTSSRLFFVGAREGHLPSSLATINIFYSTPAPSLIFLGIVTLVYLCTTQIYMLIEYTQFVESVFFMMSIGALLKLRWDYPNVERPIKVHIALPILFLIICLFLVILPIYGKPYQTCVALGLLLLGVPVYFLTIYWRNKPRWLYSTIGTYIVLIHTIEF
ncbi:SLC7A6 [Cordylochernes scorpioides]|uniref:SLC7A6 n=1 Tax=Cordylochernes scorpioides TaxID=51811 RepID=A0ABY6LAB7_9ARAC|nr:SLC7A6 [Cordylochernes scorpioides]